MDVKPICALSQTEVDQLLMGNQTFPFFDISGAKTHTKIDA